MTTLISEKKENNIITLPDIEVKKNFGIRFVTRAVSLTFIILGTAIVIAIIIAFTVHMDMTIDAEGILEPSGIYHIHSPAQSMIRKVLVSSGQEVNLNQPLVILDSIQIKKTLLDIQSQIASSKNSLEEKAVKAEFDKRQNQLSLEKSEAQLLSSKASFRDRMSGFYPHADIDSIMHNFKPGVNITLDYAMAEIQSAETDIKLKKLTIESQDLNKYDIEETRINLNKLNEQERFLKEQLKNTIIQSPISGIVLSEGINDLQSNETSEGAFLFDVADFNSWNAVLFVSEKDIHQIKYQDKVKLELNALESSENHDLYEANVTSIGVEPITVKDKYSNFAGLYRVSVKITPEGMKKLDLSKLKYGYKVQGKIITDSGLIGNLLIKYFRKIF
jgi:multidrug efflux pump subunit AcrA (membrane-fusion protein)